MAEDELRRVRRIPGWGIALLVLCLAIATALGIEALEHFARHTQLAALQAQRLGVLAGEQQDLKWHAVAEGGISPALAVQIGQSRQEFNAALAALRRLGGDEIVTRRVAAAALAFQAAMDEQLWLLGSGDLAAARHQDADVLAPAYTTLDLTVDDAAVTLEREAAWRERVFEAGAVAEIVAVLAVSALLYWYVGRLRRAAAIRSAEERALSASEARLRALVQHASDLTVIVGADSTIRWVTPSIEQILGYTPAEVLGNDVFRDLREDDSARIRATIDGQLAQPGSEARLQVGARHRDGSRRHLEMLLTNRLDDPSVDGIVVNARDVSELVARREQLEHLLERLISFQEEERRHVAYELHDGLAQVLVAVHLRLQAYARLHRPRRPEVRKEYEEILELAQYCVRETRRMVGGLRPTVLDDFGLAAALRHEAALLTEAGWAVSYHEDLDGERLPSPVELTLYRVGQEAMSNARKHAGTSRLRVDLIRRAEGVLLEVQDWGQGFLTNGVQGSGPGERVGLASMQERMSLLHGYLRIDSEPGLGTTIVAYAPIALALEPEAVPAD